MTEKEGKHVKNEKVGGEESSEGDTVRVRERGRREGRKEEWPGKEW